jgi:hypothetical protein
MSDSKKNTTTNIIQLFDSFSKPFLSLSDITFLLTTFSLFDSYRLPKENRNFTSVFFAFDNINFEVQKLTNSMLHQRVFETFFKLAYRIDNDFGSVFYFDDFISLKKICGLNVFVNNADICLFFDDLLPINIAINTNESFLTLNIINALSFRDFKLIELSLNESFSKILQVLNNIDLGTLIKIYSEIKNVFVEKIIKYFLYNNEQQEWDLLDLINYITLQKTLPNESIIKIKHSLENTNLSYYGISFNKNTNIISYTPKKPKNKARVINFFSKNR